MKLVSLENLSKYNELLSQKTVRSVNSVKPDSNGNVQLGTEKSTFNKVVYDTGYFSIGTDKTYNFDLTGSDLEHVSKENVNIRLVAKVITAHYGFNVGDIAQLSPGVDYTNSYGDLDVCAYIRGNTLYVYSGDAGALSIATGKAGHLQKANVQIKAVLTAFVPDDSSILLIAEDQTNTSKLIGLPDGTLTWKDKNLVRSVNGVNADENGNVEITTSGADLTGVVKSVNNIQPDENGNVTIEVPSADIDTSEFVKSVNGTTPDSTGNISIDIPSTDGMVKSVNSQIPDSNGNVDITIPEVDLLGVVKSVNGIQPDESGNISLDVLTTPGNIIKWETDFFDIAPNGLYSFDLSNTPFANIPREAINIQMVGKVKTTVSGFEVDDYVYPQFNNYEGSTSTSEIGSTPCIRGNVLSIRFGNNPSFVVSGPNGATGWLGKTHVKVKLILTALIEEV